MPTTSESRPFAAKQFLDSGLIVAVVTLALSLSAFIGYAGYVGYYALPIEFIQLDFTSIAKFWTGVLGLKLVVFSGVFGGFSWLMRTATSPLIGHFDETAHRFTRGDLWRVPAALLVASVVALVSMLLVSWLFQLARKFLTSEWMVVLLFIASVFIVASCVASVRGMQAMYVEIAATVAARQKALAVSGLDPKQRMTWKYQLPARWTVATFGALFAALCVYFIGWTEAESRRDYFVFQDKLSQVLVVLFSDKGAIGYDFKVCSDGRPILFHLHVLPLDDERKFVPARFTEPIVQHCFWQAGDVSGPTKMKGQPGRASADIVDACLKQVGCETDEKKSTDPSLDKAQADDEDDAGPGGA